MKSPFNHNGNPSQSQLPPTNGRYTQKHNLRFWLVLIAIVLFVIILFRLHTASRRKHRTIPPVPVVVATVKTSDMPVYIPALGSVTPTYTVTVRTQVNGQLLRVLYTEGQMVKVGDLLAEIDPRPFQAQLIQFQGQLVRDQALLANSQLDLKRFQAAFPYNAISKQQLDTQIALVKQNKGNVQVDLGQIAAVKVNLIYCEITSPINGRVGLRLVDPGNFVQTSDANGLLVINTLNPITVVFTIPEDNIPEVMQQLVAGKVLSAKAFDREQNRLLAVGKLLTIDNQIDQTTGTVKLKADFQNDNYNLFPNQFVNIMLLVKTIPNAIIIPTAAVQNGSQGPFVYLLNNDQTVSIQAIKVGINYGNYTQVVSGLSSGQIVVTEGTDKLTDGAAVTVSQPRARATSSSSERPNLNSHRRFAS